MTSLAHTRDYSRFEVERLVAWAAQECEWQQTGPLKVSYLIEAYFTFLEKPVITEDVILRLGHEVEPGLNSPDKWREVSVSVGYEMKADWKEVPRLMTQLLSFTFDDLTATEWFREFEEIHPFRDGNGRVGALLYNWLNGSYQPADLVFPPNLWADPRREGIEL